MGNPSKMKGDRAEREAVEVLRALAPELVTDNPRRKLGAGRADDEGDLDVFPDATVQVKFFPSDVNGSVRAAASGARVQSVNAGTLFHTGMVCVPGARRDSVRWLAAATVWPLGPIPEDCLAVFATVPRAVEHVRREDIGVPRRRRIAAVRYADTEEILVAPIEAWLFAYGRARARSAASERGIGPGTAHIEDGRSVLRASA